MLPTPFIFSAVVVSIPPYPARWQTNAVTVAGGQGEGEAMHQLCGPRGLSVDEDQTVYVADSLNHRIVAWKLGAITGEVVAGGNGEGNRLDQLNRPSDVIVDRRTDTLLICDAGNRRVMRWPRGSPSRHQPEIVIDGRACRALTIDDQGALYVSDNEKHEVRRYDQGGATKGTVVAGGRGEGGDFNQLSFPNHLFVDTQGNLYVSDMNNHRVMKWMKGAGGGLVVAGTYGWTEGATDLMLTTGVWVDGHEHVYVLDQGNHRVIRWEKGTVHGTVVAGGNGEGGEANQLFFPEGLSFDRHGHLYVTDQGNNRVQRFALIVE